MHSVCALFSLWRMCLICASLRPWHRFVHSAVCAQENGKTRMTVDGDVTSGEFGAMSHDYLKRWGRANGALANKSVDVPCSPLSSILARAGYRWPTTIDFLSLGTRRASMAALSTVP